MARLVFLLVLLMPCYGQTELARRVSAALHPGEPVQLTVRSLSDDSAAPFRNAIENELRSHPAGPDGAAVTITLTESTGGNLLVAEVARGGKREAVFMERVTPPAAPAPPLVLQSTLISEQDEPILDAAVISGLPAVLTPSAVLIGDRKVAISAAAPWPRDVRGRLLADGSQIRVFLPGVLCTGSDAALECKASAESWPGEPAGAAIAAGKNVFAAASVEPFFSAAQAGDEWVVAPAGGSAQLFDRALKLVTALGAWGSDIAAVETRCGAYVLATRPARGPEAVQAFAIRDRQAAPASAPLSFPGPITALWQAADRASAVAVSRDPDSGRYAAYAISVACGR